VLLGKTNLLVLSLAGMLAMPVPAVARQRHAPRRAAANRHHPTRPHRRARRRTRVHVVRAAGPAAADAPILGRTYYVSPNGSDSNSGLSPARAWRTVDQVNRARLAPGDGVLFASGSTFADDTLMPGWGTGVSGTASAPVVFGSYGQGQANLIKGIWTKNESNLVFQHLHLGPEQGLAGSGSAITLQKSTITGIVSTPSNTEFGIVTSGSSYTIRNNLIDRTGDSGMLLLGDHYLVQDNTIANTGLDRAITWGAHGIYLKAADSTVAGNTITGFHNEGISVRYRNSRVEDNTISGGEYGIAWHQYDDATGTSLWTANNISDTSILAIYVSRHDIGGYTHENFKIANNAITAPSPRGGWLAFELDASNSLFSLSGNTVR
jgi:parallel beta-helix repeat protein